MSRKILYILFILLSVLSPLTVWGTVITSDTVWEGEVLVSEDILIPAGVTLTIKPGSIIRVVPSESTKTDPEYMSPLTEITVRGILKAEGNEDTPIVFISTKGDESSNWAGLIIDGGTVHLTSCRIQNAETGIYIIKGVLDIKDSVIRGNRYGLVAQGEGTKVEIKETLIQDNDYGIFTLGSAKVDSNNCIVKNNKKKDFFAQNGRAYGSYPVKDYDINNKNISMQYGDEVLLRDTIWQGRIEINGIIRIPEGSRLIVMPGSIIEFKRKDTNGDGIGENGILIQGIFIAKGTKENPIIFRSAEKNRRMGDWDSINIMNSDGALNLIEYCQIEDAYRGLHFHFSNVAVRESIFKNNYRGIQFQESAAEIRGNYLYANKSGIQARDSEIVCIANYIYNNYYGANFLRTDLIAKGNRVVNNLKEGLRIREGIPSVEENLIDGNRYGLMVSDSLYGIFSRNAVSNNIESGISLKNSDNIEISKNFIYGNSLNGMNIQDSRALVKGNNISGNGERGIGIISFDGIITENNFVKNGIYSIGLDGGMDITAPMNWWGGDDLEKTIYDRNDDPKRGSVDYSPPANQPIIFEWPLNSISTDVALKGDINITGNVTVTSGATLTVEPGTRLLFSKGAGLRINGRIIASGKKDERITFTSFKGNAQGYWDEIFIEHAKDGIFFNCDFEHATWGIHSHFTNLTIEKCRFSNNYGGLRFRSGPLEVKRSIFENNFIGLRAYRGNAAIIENIITGNEIGIFVREKGGELTIKNNNIFTNSEYNIRSGDFNDEDINAKENWWGDGDPADKIFDGRDEPLIGKVIYEPYLKSPFKIDVYKEKM